MNARTIKSFLDMKEGVTRKVGDTFTVSEDRFKEINSTKFGILVKEVAEAANVKDVKETKKSRKKSTKKVGD